ncbi:MAG: ATP-binding protein [Elusimicrobia bacterium]|nr:ATP-binding protein [Elusimicrobiota bacterium]
MNLDPRLYAVEERFCGVKRVIAVSGWKGGVGKSVVSCVLALQLAAKGRKTGLLDLDFTGASDHLVLGAEPAFPKETDGVEPHLLAHGLKFMSSAFFLGGKAVPMRGGEVVDALRELIAITRWGELDYLIVDMPPGIGDATLEFSRLVRKTEFLAVVTPSVLSASLAAKTVALFEEWGITLAGVVENLAPQDGGASSLAPALARVAYDPALESALGSPEALLKTAFAKDLSAAADRLV